MSKVKIEIKNRWTGSVLFEYEKENNTLKDTVEQAVKEGANLQGAYLQGAYLRGANLQGANLVGADLVGAYIYLSDNEINTNDIVKQFEKDSNIKLTDTYINKNVVPTRWNCFWKYGLIICKWEIKEKEEKTEEMKEIELLKCLTPQSETYQSVVENRDKINEISILINKLIKEKETE